MNEGDSRKHEDEKKGSEKSGRDTYMCSCSDRRGLDRRRGHRVVRELVYVVFRPIKYGKRKKYETK